MSTDKPDADTSNVYAIQARRTQSNLKVRRGMLSDTERIVELETDVDKLISLVLQQQRTLEEIEDRQFKLLRLIGKRLGVHSKSTK